MNMPRFEHTYDVIVVDSIDKLKTKVNEYLEKEYLLAGEFRTFDGKFYQPMMFSKMIDMTMPEAPSIVPSDKIEEATIVEETQDVEK